jgi:dTDP-glucose 4,6-dehydratase
MSKLGWEPIISFELGMQMTVEWYLNNLLWSLNIQNGSYRLERLGVKI